MRLIVYGSAKMRSRIQQPFGFGFSAAAGKDLTGFHQRKAQQPLRIALAFGQTGAGEDLEAFARHILEGTPMIAEGEEGISSLMLSSAMLLSGWTGETIELPFTQEQDERFAALLEERSKNSREKITREIELNVSGSF